MNYETTFKIKTKYNGEIRQGPVSIDYTALAFSGQGATKAEAIRDVIGKIEAHYGLTSAVQEAPGTPEILIKNCTGCKDSLLQRVAGGLAPNYLECHNIRSTFFCKKVDATNVCPEWREIDTDFQNKCENCRYIRSLSPLVCLNEKSSHFHEPVPLQDACEMWERNGEKDE